MKPVQLQYPAGSGYQVIDADLIDQSAPWRHDAHRLAESLVDFYVAYSLGNGGGYEHHEYSSRRHDQTRSGHSA
jgi:hypothetical protein